MREQFFNSKGLTSTSANHLCALANEFIQSQKVFLYNLTFVGEKYQVAGVKFVKSKATPKEDFAKINEVLNKISLATQLIAWLKEALSEKNKAGILPSFERWAYENNITLPELPTKESYLTEEEYIRTWDVNKLNAYLTAQTYSAVFGKILHPDGEFSRARKEITYAISNPSEVEGQGRDLTIKTKIPDYTLEEVDKKFFELQNIQREYQATFNKYRHEITNALDLDKYQKDNAYNQAYDKYSSEHNSLYNKYAVWAISEKKRIADLKIVIPESLIGIYNEISGLGK